MLKMRLQRVGRRHAPSFRLVLTDSKNSTKSGRFKEILGSFDFRKTTEAFNVGRVKDLLAKGIPATDTVHNLLVTHKVIDAKKKNVLPKKTPIVKVEEGSKEQEVRVEIPVETPAETVAEVPPEPVVETPTEKVIQ